ncbi:hypothetical protein KI387_010274, partial [Taxus chinensis]
SYQSSNPWSGEGSTSSESEASITNRITTTKPSHCSWLLDASFVLECLQFYVKQADKTSSEVEAWEEFFHTAGALRTMESCRESHVMLRESKLPLFLLQKLLHMQLGLGISRKGGRDRVRFEENAED